MLTDVVASGQEDNLIAWYENRLFTREQDGTVTRLPQGSEATMLFDESSQHFISSLDFPYSVALCDLNHDSWLDVVYVSYSTGACYLGLGWVVSLAAVGVGDTYH